MNKRKIAKKVIHAVRDFWLIGGVHVAERGNRIVAETMSEDVAAVLAEGS